MRREEKRDRKEDPPLSQDLIAKGMQPQYKKLIALRIKLPQVKLFNLQYFLPTNDKDIILIVMILNSIENKLKKHSCTVFLSIKTNHNFYQLNLWQ